MEKIIYRLTLDAHKNGIQKTLQGFETADKVARRIAISLTSGSDTYEIADNVIAMMYVTTPNATVHSVNACIIDGNTIIYDVLPIEEAGITYMQLKLIGTDEVGVESVLASPKFSVEVEESMMDDNAVEQTTTFTALEEAIAKAEIAYNTRLLNVEIDNGVFRAYYADGTVYENNEIQIEVHEYIDEVMEEHLASINNSVSQAKSSEEKAKLSEVNAKLSEDNIKLSEASAKLSEENAKASEANAKQYMENAFHTTPEGYEELVEKVNTGSFGNSEGIQTSTDNTLENSKSGDLKLIKLIGASEQTPIYGEPEMMQGYIASTGEWAENPNAVCTKDFITCTNPQYIEITTEAKCTIVIRMYDATGYVKDVTRSNTTYMESMIPDTITHLKFNLQFSTEVTPETVGKVSFRIRGNHPIEHPFDCVDMMQGYYKADSGVYTYATTGLCSEEFIECKEGDVVEISSERDCTHIHLILYNGNNYHSVYSVVDEDYELNSLTHTIPSGVTHFKFDLLNTNSGLLKDRAGKVTLTINGEYLAQIKTVGKNLLDCRGLKTTTSNGVTFTPIYNASGELEYINVNGTAVTNTWFNTIDKLMPSGSYVLNTNSNYSLTAHMGYMVNASGTTVGNEWDNGGKFTLNDDTLVHFVIFVRSGIKVSNARYYPMVRRAEVEDTTYEPYKETVATILLNEPPRQSDILYNEDGLFKIERRRKSRVFSGLETWYQHTDLSNVYYHDMTESLYIDTTSTDYAIATNWYLENVTSPSELSNGGFMITKLNDTTYRVYVKEKQFLSLSSFITNLIITNATLEYDVATPTIEVLDAESQIALNSLETFDAVTYINVGGRVNPSEIVVEYCSSYTSAIATKALKYAEEALQPIKETTETTLANSKAGGYKLISMSGKTVQNTTSGKNLLPFGTVRGTKVETMACEIPSGTYVFSALVTSSDTDGTTSLVRFHYTDGDTLDTQINRDFRASIAVELTDDVNSISFYASDYASLSTGDTFTYADIQLEAGTSVTNYEPYTKGASPNPDYPQSINDSFDCVEMVQGYYDGSTGAIGSSTSYLRTKNKVECNGNETIKVTTEMACSIRFVYFTESGSFISTDFVDISSGLKEFTKTTPANAKYFAFHIYTGTTMTSDTVGKVKLTINGKVIVPIKTTDGNGKESNAYIRLSDSLRGIGDLKDEIVKQNGVWGVLRRFAEGTIGDFTWVLLTSGSKSYFRTTSNKAYGLNNLLCDSYTQGNSTVSTSTDCTIAGRDSSREFIVLDSRYTDVNTFISTMGDAIVTYELATPTFEELDTDSQIALNSLETFDGVTRIVVDSRVQPSGIEGEYGTSKVGAYTLKALLNSESNAIKLDALLSAQQTETVVETEETTE